MDACPRAGLILGGLRNGLATSMPLVQRGRRRQLHLPAGRIQDSQGVGDTRRVHSALASPLDTTRRKYHPVRLSSGSLHGGLRTTASGGGATNAASACHADTTGLGSQARHTAQSAGARIDATYPDCRMCCGICDDSVHYGVRGLVHSSSGALTTRRLDHRQDPHPYRLGQIRPSLDHAEQIGIVLMLLVCALSRLDGPFRTRIAVRNAGGGFCALGNTLFYR